MAPEPIQGGRLGPGGGGGGDEEDLTPPAGLTLGPVLSSSDDELDHNDTTDPSQVQYLPLSQDHDSDDELEYDQSSVGSLMQALATHGPNSIPEEDGTREESEEGHQQHGGGEREREPRIQRRETTELQLSQPTSVMVRESAQSREAEARREVAALWSCRASPPDRLELDGKKVEEIKSAMSSITLPPSATPPWARNLSDDDWKEQIANFLSRQQNQ